MAYRRILFRCSSWADYALRLVEVMERPENHRTAVVQTPYSAVPEAPGIVERVAGATTDLQYIIHQGFTAYGATFWVGANALLRAAALDDLCVEEQERGFTVRRYIQDRTVIEDTESSVDLVAKGWELTNYPERLSYSATPPDFGALLIQRRRWANGGLVIFPKLVRYLHHHRRRFGEAFMRSHYLTSIAGVNVGVLVLLSYPFQDVVRTVWLPLAALPYFLLYTPRPPSGRLPPQRLSAGVRPEPAAGAGEPRGVGKSLHQGLTRRKIPFGRTPKVRGRTNAPSVPARCRGAVRVRRRSGRLASTWRPVGGPMPSSPVTTPQSSSMPSTASSAGVTCWATSPTFTGSTMGRRRPQPRRRPAGAPFPPGEGRYGRPRCERERRWPPLPWWLPPAGPEPARLSPGTAAPAIDRIRSWASRRRPRAHGRRLWVTWSTWPPRWQHRARLGSAGGRFRCVPTASVRSNPRRPSSTLGT